MDDLHDVRRALAEGRASATELLADHRRAAARPEMAHTFLVGFWEQAQAAARAADLARTAGLPCGPLAGVAVSVKALFDVAGQVTTAGSKVLADAPPATSDAAVVTRLRAAGALLVGHTNMTEFAFSGVGWNPHHGTPRNMGTHDSDPTPRIPGGSSSGAATSVAGDACWVGLGSDTGGSIRIPAALQGLVGFKNTAGLTPLQGAVPLSTTLDTACAMTRSVRDAVVVHEVLAQRKVRFSSRPLEAWRFAIPRRVMLDNLDPGVARAFEAAVQRLSREGARVQEIELPELDELASLQSTGGFSAAESWSWHRRLLAERRGDYDPRVAQRIERGSTMSAADYIELMHGRRAWIDRMADATAAFDALLSPTVPITAPPIAAIEHDDAEFFRINALLLRNTSVVNMLDGCALSLPCHEPGALPVGLMVWSGAFCDDAVLEAGLLIEDALRTGAR